MESKKLLVKKSVVVRPKGGARDEKEPVIDRVEETPVTGSAPWGRVGTEVGTTLSRHFQSVTVKVWIEMPVPNATLARVEAGIEKVKELCDKKLAEFLPEAEEVLTALGEKR